MQNEHKQQMVPLSLPQRALKQQNTFRLSENSVARIHEECLSQLKLRVPHTQQTAKATLIVDFKKSTSQVSWVLSAANLFQETD